MKRSELYDLIWSMPATKVAAKYGCSSSWIKRICNLYKIPTPRQGYWAALKAGHPHDKTPLPEGPDVEIDLGVKFSSGAPVANAPSPESDAEPAPVAQTKAAKRRTRGRRVQANDPDLRPSPRAPSPVDAVDTSGSDTRADRNALALGYELAEQWHRDQMLLGFLVQVTASVSAAHHDREQAALLLNWVRRIERGMEDRDAAHLLALRLNSRRR